MTKRTFIRREHAAPRPPTHPNPTLVTHAHTLRARPRSHTLDPSDVAEASDDSDDEDTRSGTLPHSLPSTDADLGPGEMLSVARTCLPANAPETDLNLFGLLRRYVGKDLSKARAHADKCSPPWHAHH